MKSQKSAGQGTLDERLANKRKSTSRSRKNVRRLTRTSRKPPKAKNSSNKEILLPRPRATNLSVSARRFEHDSPKAFSDGCACLAVASGSAGRGLAAVPRAFWE